MIRNLLINRSNGDAPALLGKVPFRYRELARRALALTRLLPRGEREHVAILLPNGGDFVAALFGVFMAGMTAFPLNADMTAHELAPLLEYADVRTVVTTRDKNALFRAIRQPLHILFAEDLAEEQDTLPYPETESPSPEEPLLLLSTSGTTGTPKLVQLTERGFEYSVRAYIDKMDFGKYRQDEVRYFIAAPYSSVYGLLVLTVCLIRSFPVAVLEGSFSLPRFYLAVQEHAITHYEGGRRSHGPNSRPSAPLSNPIAALFGIGGEQNFGRCFGKAFRKLPRQRILDRIRHDGGISSHRKAV